MDVFMNLCKHKFQYKKKIFFLKKHGKLLFYRTLQAMKMVILSIVTSILTMLIPIPVFGFILYYTKKDDPARMMFSFTGHDLWAVLVSIIVIIWKLRFLWKAPKDSELNINNQEVQLEKSPDNSNNDDENIEVEV